MRDWQAYLPKSPVIWKHTARFMNIIYFRTYIYTFLHLYEAEFIKTCSPQEKKTLKVCTLQLSSISDTLITFYQSKTLTGRFTHSSWTCDQGDRWERKMKFVIGFTCTPCIEDSSQSNSKYRKRDDFNFHIATCNFPFLSSNIPSSSVYSFLLAHLSRRLKWAIIIAHRPSSVRPSSSSVRRRPSSSVNFHIFDFFSRTAW